MVRKNSSRIGVDESPEEIEPEKEEVEASSSGLDFVIPTEIVDLPTQGRFYPDGHPLCGCESVEIRHMTTKDQDILNSATLIKKGKALEKAVQGLLLNKAIKLDDMFIGDKNAVILQARINGISDIYEANITCPSCTQLDAYPFNLTEIKANLGDQNADVSDEGTFVVELPISKVRVEVKLLTGKDEKYLQDQAAKKKKHKLPESSLTDQFKMLIVSANDEADRGIIGKFVDAMLSKDARALQVRYNEVVPNIDLKQYFECNHCSYTDKVTIPLTANFFWPDR